MGKEIGLVLNFEARILWTKLYVNGTNKGNAALVKEFAAAKATFPQFLDV
jgi:hypothetical protein